MGQECHGLPVQLARHCLAEGKPGIFSRAKGGMVEVPGIEPGSEDLQRIRPTCLADRLVFAAAHAHRQA